MGCALAVESHIMGALYLERSNAAGGFSEDDGETLSALAAQVPVALELARMLEARQQVEKEQRNADKMEAVGRLAGGIAHDFNNMLSAIQLATEAIRDNGGVTAEVGAELDAITDATDRATELTRQLLAFSRGEMREPEIFLLNDLVTRAMPVLTRLTGPAHEVVVRLEPNLHPVKADRGQLDRVLVNLVTNARDAMPGGGRLVVETANVVVEPGRPGQQAPQPGPYAVLQVSDTGVGIEPALQAKIFEPFYTTKAERGGMGLGLATAYGIVTKSGGYIEVDSQPGEGTTFRVYLPKSTAPVVPAGQGQLVHGLPHGTETILLAEDDPLVRQSLRRVLAALGYRVLPARTAVEALEIAREQLDHVDLLVTDVVMNGMNGLELARELHKRRSGLPVLYVSGYTAGVLADRGILGQRVEFLQKPVSQQVIATRIRELLDRASRQVN
jgi:two-component system cell cycle sensor histidine kinase/response regulator CckA